MHPNTSCLVELQTDEVPSLTTVLLLSVLLGKLWAKPLSGSVARPSPKSKTFYRIQSTTVVHLQVNVNDVS